MAESEVIVAPAAEAVVADPAPAPAVVADPAPAPETPAPEIPEAEPSKAVKELIAQRKKRQDAERDAAYWKGVAEGRGEQDAAPAASETPSGPPVAPKLDQFETYEQYEAAKDKYLVGLAKHEVITEYVQNEQRKAAATAEQAFQKRIADAAKDDPTLVDVLNDPTLPISIHMAPLLKESENAPKVIRWLDQHRDDARRIATLPPLQAAREMGILEARLSFVPPVEPPKKVSSAPEPVKPVTTTSPSTVDEDNLPMAEYHQRRTAQLLTGRRQ